ncbi:MAG: hypothetical protein IJC76_07900, partial [Lachnospiraceae bacterium]|nr:hypothetical protein [Lachnospiraceae bacterium]
CGLIGNGATFLRSGAAAISGAVDVVQHYIETGDVDWAGIGAVGLNMFAAKLSASAVLSNGNDLRKMLSEDNVAGKIKKSFGNVAGKFKGNSKTDIASSSFGETRLKMNLQYFASDSSVSELKINQISLAKPGEDLYVGTFSKSTYWNKKTGLNKTHTAHHVIQDAVSSVSHGKGITINIRKDIHLKTATYGSLRKGLTNRQHLAADVRELKILLKEAGYDRSIINAQLNELIRQNKALGGFEK